MRWLKSAVAVLLLGGVVFAHPRPTVRKVDTDPNTKACTTASDELIYDGDRYTCTALTYSAATAPGAGDIEAVYNCVSGDCADIAMADGDSLDASGITLSATGEGIIVTTAADCDALSGITTGVLCYDTTDDSLCAYDGAAMDCQVLGSSGGDVTDVGDCATGACFDGSNDGGSYLRIYDGDSHYGELNLADAAGNVTLTIPAATDTLVGKATSDTFTNKTWDCNGAGNSCANIDLSADVTGTLPAAAVGNGLTDAQVLDSITVSLAATASALAANGANCAAGEIPLGVDASGAVESCYQPAEADITDLAHTATAITDGLIVEADLNEDSGTPTDADVLTFDDTGNNFNWIAQSAVAAGTAAALAANGANCAAGSYALGVDASGASESCTDATTEIDSVVATHVLVAAAHHTATVDEFCTDDACTVGVDDTITLEGGTTITAIADNEVLVGTGAAAGAFTPLFACNATTEKLVWDGSVFSCGTDAGAGGGMTSWTAQADDTNTMTVTDGETVDLAGGLGLTTTAATGTPEQLSTNIDYSLTLAGDAALGAKECVFASEGTSGGGFLCEGSTGANTNEQLYLFPALDGADTTSFVAVDATQVTDLEGTGLSIAAGTLNSHVATTDTGPSPDCSGTTTYQDGEGGCDDISSVYEAADAELTTLAGLTEAQGSIIIGDATPAWSALGIGAANAVLLSNATTAAWDATPALVGTDFTGIPSSAILNEVRSMYWPAGSLTTDAANACLDPVEVTLVTGLDMYTVICTDSDDGEINGQVTMPDGYDAAGTATVTFELTVMSDNADPASPALSEFELDFECHCFGNSDVLATLFGGTEQPANIDFEASGTCGGSACVQYELATVTTAAVTCDGTCAAGDLLLWQGAVDATATTATVADVHIIGVKMEYTTTIGD